MRIWSLPLLILVLAGCASTPDSTYRSSPVSSGSPAGTMSGGTASGGGWGSSPAAPPISQDHLLALVTETDHQKVGRPYTVAGQTFTPYRDDTYDRVGIASWYGPNFHGRPTANGEVFDQERLTAAHTTLPIPSIVEVTNLENGRTIRVRVNDRGPFVDDRIIDLSRASARELDFLGAGLAEVRVRYIGPAAPVGAAPSTFISAPGAVDAGSAVDDLIAARVLSSRTATPATARGSAPSGYRLQLGAFYEYENARALADRMAPIAEAQIDRAGSDSAALHRVFLGPFASRSAAEAERQRLRREGVYDTAIMAMD